MNDRFVTFTILINRISRNIRKIENQEMAEFDLRRSHISYLYYLYSCEGMTATDLSKRCEEDKASVSRSLSYLEENGFLVCEDKNPKRYRSPLVLTDKGRRTAKRIAEKIDFILDEIKSELTDEEREEFYRCLSLISRKLDDIAEKKED